VTDISIMNAPRATAWIGTLGAQIRAELLMLLRNPAALIPTMLFPIMF
jgi:hypothetical protein